MTAGTIAIVGAGPGIGLAVAERFGREGFRVALLSRSGDADGTLRARLSTCGVEATAFQADVTDRAGLERALADATQRLGGIDVLEYSPTPPAESMRSTRAVDVANAQFHLDLQPLGAIAAVNAVLPAMLARGTGSLLFTTAASAQHPAAMTASFGIAAGALRNYVRLLHYDLSPVGLRAGLVSIAGVVVDAAGQTPPGFPPSIPKVFPADVADLHWAIHQGGQAAEVYCGDIDALLKVPGLY